MAVHAALRAPARASGASTRAGDASGSQMLLYTSNSMARWSICTSSTHACMVGASQGLLLLLLLLLLLHDRCRYCAQGMSRKCMRRSATTISARVMSTSTDVSAAISRITSVRVDRSHCTWHRGGSPSPKSFSMFWRTTDCFTRGLSISVTMLVSSSHTSSMVPSLNFRILFG